MWFLWTLDEERNPNRKWTKCKWNRKIVWGNYFPISLTIWCESICFNRVTIDEWRQQIVYFVSFRLFVHTYTDTKRAAMEMFSFVHCLYEKTSDVYVLFLLWFRLFPIHDMPYSVCVYSDGKWRGRRRLNNWTMNRHFFSRSMTCAFDVCIQNEKSDQQITGHGSFVSPTLFGWRWFCRNSIETSDTAKTNLVVWRIDWADQCYRLCSAINNNIWALALWTEMQRIPEISRIVSTQKGMKKCVSVSLHCMFAVLQVFA